MVVIIRSSLASASRMGVARINIHATQSVAALPRNLRTSAVQLAQKPTGSEANVHAEKNDADPAKLQRQTANKAQKEHESSSSNRHTAAANDQPTHSEDFVKADKHEHDPLPDHKKASKE